MSNTVFCQKLQREAPSLDMNPYPGALGEKIYTKISKEAWQMWLSQQTILINEYRLNPLEKEARVYLEQEMEKFLFGEINP